MSEENENAVNNYIMSCGSGKKLCKGLGSTELMAAATQSFQECNPIGSVGIPLVRTNCRIEKAIYSHPAVELCCVVGVPDEERINYPKAFVVLKPGESRDVMKDEILEICRQKLPAYMIPEDVICRNDLPRTPRGKVDYRELEKMALDSNLSST